MLTGGCVYKLDLSGLLVGTAAASSNLQDLAHSLLTVSCLWFTVCTIGLQYQHYTGRISRLHQEMCSLCTAREKPLAPLRLAPWFPRLASLGFGQQGRQAVLCWRYAAHAPRGTGPGLGRFCNRAVNIESYIVGHSISGRNLHSILKLCQREAPRLGAQQGWIPPVALDGCNLDRHDGLI